jgi:hypothetical protein
LHDVLSLPEHVRDAYGSYELPVRWGDGERIVPDGKEHFQRGGSGDRPELCRVTRRLHSGRGAVRPVRRVER